jgi:hypothetical protein
VRSKLRLAFAWTMNSTAATARPPATAMIPTGERSGLLTHIAATESVALCVRMKR